MANFLTPVDTNVPGELVFAETLKQKLNDKYLCWHNAVIKPNRTGIERIPDFILFHPEHGLWVLDVKEWSLGYITGHNPQKFTVINPKNPTPDNPHFQTQKQAFALTDLLKEAPILMKGGRLSVPLIWGTIFCNIPREQFEYPGKFRPFPSPGKLGNIPSNRVICADELNAGRLNRTLEQRLLDMFGTTRGPRKPVSDPQVSAIRSAIFPDIQIFAETAPSKLTKTNEANLLDLDQEKILRRLTKGAHVLVGVAGSGKTIILLNKARELVEQEGSNLSVLYLCRGTCVAKQIQSCANEIGLPKDAINSFHKWCVHVLEKNNVTVPHYTKVAATLIQEFKRGKIKVPKYDVVLLDEGHDFRDKPEWLPLIVSARKSAQSLFVMAYDGAQALYDKDVTQFNFDFLGSSASIEKHILRKNYRNTEQILLLAKVLNDAFLKDSENAPDPKVRPVGYGAQGKLPVVFECDSLDEELQKVVAEIKEAYKSNRSWSDIAVLFHTDVYTKLEPFSSKIYEFLDLHRIPCSQKETDFSRNVVKIMSITKAKGLGFGMVCIVGLAQTEFSNFERENDKVNKKINLENDIRYLYTALTRACEELIITYTKPLDGSLSSRRVIKVINALERVRASEPKPVQNLLHRSYTKKST